MKKYVSHSNQTSTNISPMIFWLILDSWVDMGCDTEFVMYYSSSMCRAPLRKMTNLDLILQRKGLSYLYVPTLEAICTVFHVI